VEVDLRLDSRVESAMSDEAVFFGPYGGGELDAVVGPQLDMAFRDEALPAEVREYGIHEAARRWGDPRKTLRLFRRAGEAATKQETVVTRECIGMNLAETDAEATKEKLLSLPFNHFIVIVTTTFREDEQTGEILQPVTTDQIAASMRGDELPADLQLSDRVIREIIRDLVTMGLVETWIESRGRDGRVKQIETTFDPQWARDVLGRYLKTTPHLDLETILPDDDDDDDN